MTLPELQALIGTSPPSNSLDLRPLVHSQARFYATNPRVMAYLVANKRTWSAMTAQQWADFCAGLLAAMDT